MQKRIPDRPQLLRLYVQEGKSLSEIGKKFGFSPTTVGKWLKLHNIPARPARPLFDLKKIDGKIHKLCRGPTHKEPTYVPVTKFLRRADGKPRPHCTACESHYHGSEQLVDFTSFYRGKLESIVNRLGKMEASRRLGISQAALWNLLNPKRGGVKIKARTARSIIRVLQELNTSQEVRHKDSIHYGAYLRGKPEKPVTMKKHLYKVNGDEKAERKRNERAAR